MTCVSEDIVLEKCAEECSGEEEKLLSFRDSCIIVESVFGKVFMSYYNFQFQNIVRANHVEHMIV